MKTFLPISLAAIVVGTAGFSAFNRPAHAEPAQGVRQLDIAEVRFLTEINIPGENLPGRRVGILSGTRGDGARNQIKLVGDEFIYTSPEAGTLYFPMSAVAFYRIAEAK